LGDGNDCAPGDTCCDRPNNLCNGFLDILPGPAIVKGGLALKKWHKESGVYNPF
jgi:hypothetical protein